MMLAAGIGFYQIGFYVLVGFGMGLIAGVRVAPPTEDVEVKLGSLKLKIRGRNNTVTDGIDITDIIDIAEVDKKVTKRDARKLARAERKKQKENVAGNDDTTI